MPLDTETACWSAACDAVAAELLAEAGIGWPPVDAFTLAQRLNVEVAFDGNQQSRGRHKRLAGAPSIFLKPDDRPERLQWAAAHELGEWIAPRLFDRLGIAGDDIAPENREQLANRFAAHLLLPACWFSQHAQHFSGDILQLKRHYGTASHELIALRLLDLPEASIITIFDQGRITRRRGNMAARPSHLQPLERGCWQRVHGENRPCAVRSDSLRVTGWPIHEPGWKREILRTMPADDCE